MAPGHLYTNNHNNGCSCDSPFSITRRAIPSLYASTLSNKIKD